MRSDTTNLLRRRLSLALASAGFAPAVLAQGAGSTYDTQSVLLAATSTLTDPTYRETVVIATPAPAQAGQPGRRHVGLILNRPTAQTVGGLFPEHAPSRAVTDPVHFGGPAGRNSLVALAPRRSIVGNDSIPVSDDLALAFRSQTVDSIIERAPNDARYFVGFVVWRPDELRQELQRGLWKTFEPRIDLVMRRDTRRIWRELAGSISA